MEEVAEKKQAKKRIKKEVGGRSSIKKIPLKPHGVLCS